MDIIKQRLANQYLLKRDCRTAHEVVSYFGAVQAQEFPSAKWALSLRMKNPSDVDVMKEFNDGKILRTHIMRPTWHFVNPPDLKWIEGLTSHRVKTLMNHYNRKLELDDKLFRKSTNAITKALKGNNYLTRQELKKILEGIGIKTDVQRLAHIVMWPELDAVICSGPMKGKQFTYALYAERVRKPKSLIREEALAKLALKYFTSHGPAQLKDFSWWSGLTMKDAQDAVSLLKSKLISERVDGKEYWLFPTAHRSPVTDHTAFLLSIYDEYTIAYKDRSALGGERYIEKMLSMGNLLIAVVVLDGKVVGSWKRKVKKDMLEITLNPLRKLGKSELKSLKSEGEKYTKFLGLTRVEIALK